MLNLTNSLKNFLTRPLSDIILVFESLYYLLKIKYFLNKYTFNYLSKKYSLYLEKNENFLEVETKEMKSISWAIERTALLLPWDDLCLIKALTAQRMLIRKSLNATLYMGVKKDKDNKRLEAHAWVKYNDYFITGRAGHDEFTVVSKFTWDTL